jgi:hypothetical protein
MIGLLCFALAVLASPFKSKLRLEAENAVLRHQLNVLRRRLHGRARDAISLFGQIEEKNRMSSATSSVHAAKGGRPEACYAMGCAAVWRSHPDPCGSGSLWYSHHSHAWRRPL